jgi:hypothetical protein
LASLEIDLDFGLLTKFVVYNSSYNFNSKTFYWFGLVKKIHSSKLGYFKLKHSFDLAKFWTLKTALS